MDISKGTITDCDGFASTDECCYTGAFVQASHVPDGPLVFRWDLLFGSEEGDWGWWWWGWWAESVGRNAIQVDPCWSLFGGGWHCVFREFYFEVVEEEFNG